MTTIVELERLAVSVDEAARLIGVNRAHLYPLVMGGTVPSFKLGARRLIPVEGLRRWVEEQAGARP